MKSNLLTKILPSCLILIIDLIVCSKLATETGITFKLNKAQGQFKNRIKGKIRNMEGENEFTQIYGNSSSLNYYYVNLFIGNPPKKQSVIIDTGSHLTSVPCQPLCESCGKHVNSYFTISSKLNVFIFILLKKLNLIYLNLNLILYFKEFFISLFEK